MKDVAVVILNWNGVSLLSEYLPEVLRCTPSDIAEVVVADNGSTDGSLAYLEGIDDVHVIKLEQNYGFAGGYNRAIAQLDHRYILLLNSDARPTEGWLRPLYDLMEEDPQVVAAQPKILWERQPECFEYAGALGGYLDKWGYPFCRGRIFDTLEHDEGQYGEAPLEVFWTTGAAMMVRREAFVAAGGFDERYFAHQEEIDLCWRWQCTGYQLRAVPTSVVYHLGGASLGAENPRKTYLNFRNNLRMLYKLLPKRHLYTTLLWRFLLDHVAAIAFLCQGKWQDAWAVVRADWTFICEPKARPTGLDRDRGYKQLYPYSLLWRYHIHGERYFSQLRSPQS
ncbi:MAG: glycosyltransferase family 2 protein [Porphyromonas sp.]|nr:glycosyltransferase family 2 protein [Porphyromonas sp.]